MIQSKSASIVVGFLEEVFLSVGLIEVDNFVDNNDFITFLRSDNGTEFVAKDVRLFVPSLALKKRGTYLFTTGTGRR